MSTIYRGFSIVAKNDGHVASKEGKDILWARTEEEIMHDIDKMKREESNRNLK